MSVPADNPIRHKDQDQLGRARVAEVIAAEIRSLDASEGCVVGLLGPWGSGKTSLLNLVRDELTAPPGLVVLEFNPWMFSGTDELLERFFLELGAQFRSSTDRLADLADEIEVYGEVVAPLRLLPIIGVWVERARSVLQAIKKARKRREGGVLEQRARLAKRLAELQAPIVIIIDDLDRLHTDEIRNIFKLVRLTANFPNLIYVLAFDRHRVELALSEEGLVGRDFLEKILQVAYDIPVVPQELLTSRLTTELQAALEDIDNPGLFDSSAWPDVLIEILRPLIRNLRDVRRYVASLHGTLQGLEGRVALVDVLALEAVRVFLPDAFAALVEAQEALTSTRSLSPYGQDPPHLKASIDALLAADKYRGDVVRAMVTRLFLAAGRHIGGSNYGPDWEGRWLRERRVAHPEVLKFYLERIAGQQLQAFGVAERAFQVLGDENALKVLLDTLDGVQLADTITALEVYQEDFPPESVEGTCTVLMNQLHRVSARPTGFFDMRPDLIVGRVVLRLLQRLGDEAEVEAAVRRILPKLDRLSDRFDLLLLVGHKEAAGHKLISESAGTELEEELRTQVRAASVTSLAEEHDLLRLLSWAREQGTSTKPAAPLPEDPGLDAALLKQAVTETKSQQLDSRAVTRNRQLFWDTLVELAGDEAAIQRMVDRVADRIGEDQELSDAVELVGKYLEGWRPRDL
jgi:energy-coupling factor transporter ATP-binding protein EcfA2